MREVAPEVAIVPMIVSHAYLVGTAANWVLVDAGTPGNAGRIRRAAAARFGAGARPRAIVLTHGHMDHAGSAPALARCWSAPVYAHSLELPYLTGRSHYPPLDPTPPGFFSALSRLFPSGTVNLGGAVEGLPADLPLPGLDGWVGVYTPGHTPGHVAFFRPRDRVLLAGDSVTTMDLNSCVGTLWRRPQVCGPPVPATTDWIRARASVERLAALRPDTIAAAHGMPMHGAAGQLVRLAETFRVPPRGRYVKEPVRADENGVVWLPPKPFDVAPVVAATAAAAAAAWLFLRR